MGSAFDSSGNKRFRLQRPSLRRRLKLHCVRRATCPIQVARARVATVPLPQFRWSGLLYMEPESILRLQTEQFPRQIHCQSTDVDWHLFTLLLFSSSSGAEAALFHSRGEVVVLQVLL